YGNKKGPFCRDDADMVPVFYENMYIFDDGVKADFVVVFEENTGKADMVPVSDENMHVSDDGVKDEFVADFVVVFEENTGKADMVPVSDENMHVSDDGVKDEFVVVPNSKLTGGEFHLFGE
ncbi:hypothetical protein Tco_1443795, partial [Tanacetum coccineum]